MLSNNFLLKKLQEGKSVIGTWSIIPSAVNAEIIASTGIDFIIIDNEHGSINFETAHAMIMACELQGVSPMYRPPSVYEPDILKALDLGFHGVQVPNVSEVYQLYEIIKFSKFPPAGNRGFSPFVRASGYSHFNASKHIEQANQNTLLAINIEGKQAINQIDEFLLVKELDIIFLGAFDLSKAMGIPGQVDHPNLLNLLQKMTKKIKNSGKHVGTITTSKEKLQQFLDFGMDYLVHFVDCEMLRAAYAEPIQYFKQIKR